MWHHQILKSKAKEPTKFLSSSGVRGYKFMSVYNFQLNSVLCFETRAFGILNFGVMVVLVWHGGVCQKKCISITIFSYLRHYSILKQCLCECLFVVHIVTWTKTKIINKLLRVHNTDWKSSLNVNFFKNRLCNWVR